MCGACGVSITWQEPLLRGGGWEEPGTAAGDFRLDAHVSVFYKEGEFVYCVTKI